MDDTLCCILEDKDKFHYKQAWLNASTKESGRILELFAFGTVGDIPAGLELSPLMYEKLQKLSIISLSERYKELSYLLIAEQCKIDSPDNIERLLIELQNIFQVKLDPIRQVAVIQKWFDCRDVYANEMPLVIVQNIRYDKDSLLDKLAQWKNKLSNEILLD